MLEKSCVKQIYRFSYTYAFLPLRCGVDHFWSLREGTRYGESSGKRKKVSTKTVLLSFSFEQHQQLWSAFKGRVHGVWAAILWLEAGRCGNGIRKVHCVRISGI